MNKRMGIALRILSLLAESEFPGMTRGEIRKRLGVPSDTEITARCRELRRRVSYGQFKVRVETGEDYRYWLPYKERKRAKAFLADWRVRKTARTQEAA